MSTDDIIDSYRAICYNSIDDSIMSNSANSTIRNDSLLSRTAENSEQRSPECLVDGSAFRTKRLGFSCTRAHGRILYSSRR
jgi:hypothetical protein